MSILGSGKRRHKIRRSPSVYYQPRIKKRTIGTEYFRYANLLKLPVLIVVLVYFTFFSPFFMVSEITLSGNENISADRIMPLLPSGKNIFILNSSQVEERITSEIPEISGAKVYKGLPNAIKVTISERTPKILWLSGGKEYLVNERGEIYKDITGNSSAYQSLIKVTDNKNLTPQLPSRIVTDNFVSFVVYLNDNLKTEVNLDPDGFFVDETTVDIILKTKDVFYIKFDSLRSPTTQMNNLKMVLMEKKSEIMEYVDLRVNGWAYYK